MRINQLFLCQNLVDLDEKAEIKYMNLRINGFNEIKRDHIDFIKKFIHGTEESHYVLYYLSEVTSERFRNRNTNVNLFIFVKGNSLFVSNNLFFFKNGELAKTEYF